MSRKSLTIENYSASEIKSIINSNDLFKVGLKLHAIYQVALGKSCLSLEDVFHYSGRQINNWVHQFNESGLDGLIDKEGRGRNSHLSSLQKQQLIKLLDRKTPEDYGINSATWNGLKKSLLLSIVVLTSITF